LAQPTLRSTYTSELGVREATGKNDGVRVEMYLKNAGVSKGAPWCAAFVKWCLDKAQIKNNITAWSPTTHNKNNVVYFQKIFLKKPDYGDVFTVYFISMKRIGHTGFYDGDAGNGMFYTVEGNSNDNGSRDGIGVFRLKRRYHAIYSITRWQNK
jgi:hypothetical protein